MTSDITSYLIRSLLSEGRIRYEVVEKTNDGMKPRLIEKEGPTGLQASSDDGWIDNQNGRYIAYVANSPGSANNPRPVISKKTARRSST